MIAGFLVIGENPDGRPTIQQCFLTISCEAHVKREPVPQLNMNLNFSLQLPPTMDPAALGQGMQEVFNQLMQQVQNAAAKAIHAEIVRQMPAVGIEVWTQNGAWREQDGWAS